MQDHHSPIAHYRRAMVVLLFFCTLASVAQPFNAIPVGMVDAGRSTVAWGDFDNDGDLDVFLAGLGAGDVPVGVIYRNDEGSFTSLEAPVPGFRECSAAWGDCDGDNDLDLLVSGNTAEGDLTQIYLNDGGEFTGLDAGLPGAQGGEVCWTDFDGDGDLDIFVTGSWWADLYENRDGTFAAFPQDFGFFGSSAADWGDFDNDGDLDLLIIGDSGAGAVSKVFRNDHGVFSDAGVGFDGLMSGAAEWVDYNNDGLLDAAIAGYNDALEAEFFLYKNTGFGQFSYAFTGIEGFATGDMDWGDYDNDGDADMVMSGKATGCGAVVAGIYRNDGGDLFYKMSYTLLLAIRCSLQWADYENDGDLDLLLAGMDYGEAPHTVLYRNEAGANLFFQNTVPSAPAGLAEQADDGLVILSWEKASDDQTDQDALSYNLRLGSSIAGSQVAPALSDPATGFHRVASLGNAGQKTEYTILGLEPGTYYWSVQAIDQGFLGSGFAPERSFTIGTIGINDKPSNEYQAPFYPNPADEILSFNQGFLTGNSKITISDVTGRCHLSLMVSDQENTVDVSSLAPGIYFLIIMNSSAPITSKLIIR